jgi:probable F420-dependent oxidoreductase
LVTPRLRRFRFGLMAENVRAPGEMVELARRAEATGYATMLTRDHFVKEPFGHQLGPIVALAVAAEATTTLRLGSLVFCNDYRHPVLLAQEAATLDLLSNGRLELGLGAGFHREEYGQAGIPFERPGLRVDRLEESLRVLKGLFSDGPLTFAGRHYKISDLNGFPKPVQAPHPPFHVAAFGPRMLGIAGREADIINLQSGSLAGGALVDHPADRLPEAVEERVENIRQAAGARFDEIELSAFLNLVTAADRRRAAEDLARSRGWTSTTPEQVLSMPAIVVGDTNRIIEELQARRERFGLAYWVVSQELLHHAEPLVARLAGT